MPILPCVVLLLCTQPDPNSHTPDPVRRLTHVTTAYATFSPDGARLVYQSNDAGNYDLYVMDARSLERRRIVADPAHDITPVFSPDSTTIAFVSERDANREVYLCDADGSNPRNLSDHPAQDIHPVFTPDGSRILFSRNRDNNDPEDYDLYTMRPDGSDLRQLTDGPAVDTYASFSPDSSRIVTRRAIDGNSEVFLLDADGTNPVNLTNSPAFDGWRVWSPDGARIAFASGQPGVGVALYLISPDATNLLRLTHDPDAEDRHPAFSPDGRTLTFTRYRAGRAESSDLVAIAIPRH